MNLSFEETLQEAVKAENLGDLEQAMRHFNDYLKLDPKHPFTNYKIGMLHLKNKKFRDAEPFLQTALENAPDVSEYWIIYIELMIKLGEQDEGLKILNIARKNGVNCETLESLRRRIININQIISIFETQEFEAVLNFSKTLSNESSDDFVIWLIIGAANQSLNKHKEASSAFKKVISLNPQLAAGYNNLGISLKEMNLCQQAIKEFKHALFIKPNYPEAINNLGITFQKLGDLKAASETLSSAISIEPNYADAVNNLANVLQELGRYDEAEKTYKKAIALKPSLAEAHNGLGVVYSYLGKSEEAINSFQAALEISPNHSFAYSQLIHEKTKVCDWSDISYPFTSENGSNKLVMPPFALLALSDNPSQELEVSSRYTDYLFPKLPTKKNYAVVRQDRKLRVGYFSADFKDHPVCRLLLRVFEIHNRKNFEVFGYSLGKPSGDQVFARAVQAFDQFKDLSLMSDNKIVSVVESDKIDIAIDLSGYTKNHRVNIFSKRLAPIQINYLGFPGSMGAQFMDYIIADKYLIPPKSEKYYSEKIIFMPHCYQAQDNTIETQFENIKRENFNLPKNNFVFCAINASYKISEQAFIVWTNLLLKKPKSVLWLLKENDLSEQNLRKFAARQGVDPARLIFSKRCPFEDYMKKFCLVDIFLDTFNYNAGATAANALWSGVPIITLEGKSYSARMAGSLLRALDLQELIAPTVEKYFEKALGLANDKQALTSLKRKLVQNIKTKPLFDSELFTSNLEKGYETAFNIYQKKQTYENIFI